MPDFNEFNHLNNASTRYRSFANNGYMHYPGSNGISGFKQWECYMLLKYGKPGQFGIGGDDEYLIELPMYPEEVQESINANWEDQNVLGRSSSLAAYANTSLKSVSFSLDLHRDFLTGSYSLTGDELTGYLGGSESANQYAGHQLQDSDGPFDTRTWYVSANKMLQMSCYPQYTSSGMIPPTTYFIFGQMILKGFVESYSTTWKKPIINTFYAWNSVSITMKCYPDYIMSARDFIKNYSSSSTQNTYNTQFPNIAMNNNSDVMSVERQDVQHRNNYRNGSLGGNVMDIG